MTSCVQAHTQLESPLCGGAHGASRAALTKLTLLHTAGGHAACAAGQAPRHEGSYMHTGTVLTNACKAGFASMHLACLHVQVHAQ